MKAISRLLLLLTSSALLITISMAADRVDHRQTLLTPYPVRVEAGWNLLSIPVSDANGVKTSLMPSAISDAFLYENGYHTGDTLINGNGFWLKFASAETLHIEGNVLLQDTDEVHPGWNMIGSVSMPVAVNMIRSNPAGIISSRYFSFIPGGGYHAEDTLKPGQGYWVKATLDGKIYLTVLNVPCYGMPSVTYAGKTYGTVQIGNQCWMKENLDIGTMIQGLDTVHNNGEIEKYCYDNDTVNCRIYGGLYTWNEAMEYDTASGDRGICPMGWHIPSVMDFQSLSDAVGADGNAMKAVGQGTGDGAGTDWDGFSAYLAGNRGYNGYFGSIGVYAGFWSSTQADSLNAAHLYLYSADRSITPSSYVTKDFGLTVRCIRDGTPIAGLPIGSLLPEMNLPDASGNMRSLNAIETEKILIVFYSASCPHCTTLLPQLSELSKNNFGITVLAISLDTDRNEWLNSTHPGNPNWIDLNDGKGWSGKAALDYSVFATPTMILTDHTKKILAKPLTIEELMKLL